MHTSKEGLLSVKFAMGQLLVEGGELARNLERALAGQPLVPYQPQKRTLYLLATGSREAILSWGGLSASGHWVWRWKDWIDRRFMRQYHSREKIMSGQGT